MSDYKLTYFQYSERAILVQWPKEISQDILKDVLIFKKHLEIKHNKQILQINYTYNSILIYYILTIDNIYDEIFTLKQYYSQEKSHIELKSRIWKIPVCYEEKFGLDLDEISQQKDLSKQQIIDLHSSPIYTIFFVGFLPGFLYLGGLDDRLQISRKKSPRLKVEKGAVGIANNQTGIYPFSTPGGWRIIGNSPIEFFDSSKSDPCFAISNDKLKFVPVSMELYEEIHKQVKKGIYELESEVMDG